jgi:hypothetical protein
MAQRRVRQVSIRIRSALNFSTSWCFSIDVDRRISSVYWWNHISTLLSLHFLTFPAKGKSRIEVYRRETEISARRAFAVITLSLLVIGLNT